MIRILQILALMPVLFVSVTCAPSYLQKVNATFSQLDPKHDSIIIGRTSRDDKTSYNLIEVNKKRTISLEQYYLRDASLTLGGYFFVPITPGKYVLKTSGSFFKGGLMALIFTPSHEIPVNVEAGKLINLGYVKFEAGLQGHDRYIFQEDPTVLFHFGNLCPNIYDSYKSNIIDMSSAEPLAAK